MRKEIQLEKATPRQFDVREHTLVSPHGRAVPYRG